MTKIFKPVDHKCKTPIPESFPPDRQKGGLCYQLKKFWFSLILVSTENALTIQHFSSESQIRNEKKRQYYSPNYFIIHPLSKLAAVYDTYLCILHLNAIFFKLIDVAFLRNHLMGTKKSSKVIDIINIIDVLTWFNLVFRCFVGVIRPKQKSIVINFYAIITYRVKHMLFWCQLISSVPKCMICPNNNSCTLKVWLLLTGCRLFIIFVVTEPIKLIKQSLVYLKIVSRRVLIIVQLSYLMAFVTHVMACTGYATSRYRYAMIGSLHNNTWILYRGLIDKDIFTQYSYAFFRASSQTFGVSINEFEDNINWEESVISVFNYAAGKIIYFIMWVALLHVLLAKNLQDTRFQEIITQLSTWMDNKELPKDLQKRVINYYNFYYRKRFFSKQNVQKGMPDALKAKVKVNMYKILKESNLAMFSKLSEDEIQRISEHFVTEVYSANDIIVYSGMKGRSLYLVASGTVAVYSHSGKEVCHLHDGAYFGELSLLMKDQRITATIIAIETTKIYKIARNYFEQYILSNAELREMFFKQAESRLQVILKVEGDYRKALFVKKYTK